MREAEEARRAIEKAERSSQEAEKLKEREAVEEEGRKRLAELLKALKLSQGRAAMATRHNAGLTAQNAAPQAAPAATPSPTRSREAADMSLQQKLIVVEKWDIGKANRFAVRATEIYENLHYDITIAEAVSAAKVDTVQEQERESWETVKGRNATSHKRSPAKSADVSTRSDEPLITAVKSADQVNKELLARSRLKEFRPSKLIDEGTFLGYQETKREFNRATVMDGLQAEDKWSEIKFYFGGLALDLAGVRATGETALKRAFERMDRHFGARKLSPRESLQYIIDAGPIKEDDSTAHVRLALLLEREVHKPWHRARDQRQVTTKIT